MKKSKLKIRLFKLSLVLIILILTFVMFAIYFKGNITPVVLSSSEATVIALGVSAINQAASVVLSDGYTYDDLFLIEYDNDHNVAMIKANSPKINTLARNMASMSQANLELLGMQTLQIPIGTFTGLNLLTGQGPPIDIHVMPIGRVICDFKSQFIEAGINQTVHKIYIDVQTYINIILPIDDVEVEISTEILICENLIVGKVPEFYLGGGLGSILDLIPS